MIGPDSGGRTTPTRLGAPLLGIEPVKVATWNLTVEEHPEFFAGGVLVHNCLDTVAMSKFVLKLRRTKVTSDTPLHQRPLVQRLLAGEVHDARGVPLGLGIDPTRIPLSTAFALIDSRESQEKTRASRV